MAEPPKAAFAATAAHERDVLLATKLHVPALRPGMVPRPRLAERIDDELQRGLALVCAPAGYGKTVLLAEWAQCARRPTAWLSLDAGDNDPARFWRHAVAALDRVRPGIGERVGPLLGPPAPPSFEGVVTALVNELADQSGDEEISLVLDDYHVLSSQPVHASVGFLLEHRPAGMHVALASRSDPPLPLARLRARGQLTELRAAELRFTIAEAEALLQQVAALSPDAVAALAARTEGWAAGLQLAALSLRDQPDVSGFVAAFTGSHRYILDFLAEEVLERQGDTVRTFLLETSVLERLSGSLCDALTGRTDSQEMLEQIDRAGLFLIPLDEVRGWWRYHHLFADLLRSRLEQQPGRATDLHRMAATWHEQRGLTDDAIHHTLAAGDKVWAARLVEEHFDTVFNLRGEEATIQRWLPALPDDLVRSRPRLLLAQAQMAAMRGDVDTMEPLIDAAELVAGRGAEEPFEPTAGRAGSLLVNVPAVIALQRSYIAQLRGDAEGTVAHTAAALARVNDGELMLKSAVQGFLAMAEWLRGRLAEAERAFASTLADWRTAGQLTMTAWGHYSLARIQRARGNLDAAVVTCRQDLEFTAPATRRPYPAAGPALVGLAEVSYQRNELDVALGYVTEGIALCRQFVHTPPLAAGLVTLAWIHHAAGDQERARAAVDEAMLLSLGPVGLVNPVPAHRAKLLLLQGDVATAAQFVQDSGLSTDEDVDYSRELGHVVLARVLLAQGCAERALALLDRLHAAALGQQRTVSVIEIGALRSLALAACGDEARAIAALAQTMAVASPQGYVRAFVDEGPAMSALFGRLLAAHRAGRLETEVPHEFVTRLVHCFGAERSEPRSGSAPPSQPGLIEPLTGRELEVLAMLAAGRSNQAIAGELVVTLDTVKKHVSHVLSKLGATNRTEAVALARESGVIPSGPGVKHAARWCRRRPGEDSTEASTFG